MIRALISFTGHRDMITNENELINLIEEFPDSLWRHGGAIGFDAFVSEFARKRRIKEIVIRPYYNKFGRAAPIIRNKDIIYNSDLLVACYDGRDHGGTLYTVNLAKKMNIPIRFVETIKK